jgi:hypothetical protein
VQQPLQVQSQHQVQLQSYLLVTLLDGMLVVLIKQK